MRATGSVAVALAVITGAVAAGPAMAMDDPQVVLSDGHVDVMSVHLEDDALIMRLKDDTGASAVYRDPADVILQATPEAISTVPDDPFASHEFLGPPGSQVWWLRDYPVPGLLFPGWSTETIFPGMLRDDEVTLTLLDVSGPGDAFVFFYSLFGEPEPVWNSTATLPQSTQVMVRTHVHANWVFTAEGTYALTWQASGTLPDGTEVSTAPVDYTWVVGELPDQHPIDGVSQDVTVSIDQLHGALIVSIDPNDRVVELPPATLAPSGERLETSGALRPVTVTDTRADAPGWNVSGQVSGFVSEDSSFSGKYLGWTPVVVSQAPGQEVIAGPTVPTRFGGKKGLSKSATLAMSPAGSGIGTAVLGADLVLQLPTRTKAGVYHATLTITAI